MNVKTIAIVTGAVVAVLGLGGLLGGETKLFGAMNIDLMLDLARIGLGAMLIVMALRSDESAQNALMIFGLVYLGMFALGLISPTLFGLLPDGLGWLDQTLHLGGGILGLLFTALGATNKSRGNVAA